MKTTITKHNTPTGYAIIVTDDNDQTQVLPIDKTYPGEPFTLVLPINPSNRKYFNSKKVDAAGGTIELTYKESKTITKSDNSAPRKSLMDYMSEDDKKLYNEILERTKKARDEATKKKPLTELEKAQRQYDKWLAKVQELSNKQ